MEDKIVYEHQVYSNDDTRELAEAAALGVDRLAIQLNSNIERMLAHIPDAPSDALKEFQDSIDDAAANLFGTISKQYDLGL